MSVFHRQKVQDLRAWLGVATKELAAPAKERIRLEIEAHYAEAVAAHLEEGLSESDAPRAALAELGDADKASKCFRKQHLTTREVELVEQAFRLAGSRWQLLCSYLIFCACLFLDPGKPYSRSFLLLLAVAFVTAVIVPTTVFIMMRRKSKNMGFLLLTRTVALYVFFLDLYYFVCGFGFAFLGFSCIVITAFLRILLKVRHVAKVWDEVPLPNE